MMEKKPFPNIWIDGGEVQDGYEKDYRFTIRIGAVSGKPRLVAHRIIWKEKNDVTKVSD